MRPGRVPCKITLFARFGESIQSRETDVFRQLEIEDGGLLQGSRLYRVEAKGKRC